MWVAYVEVLPRVGACGFRCRAWVGARGVGSCGVPAAASFGAVVGCDGQRGGHAHQSAVGCISPWTTSAAVGVDDGRWWVAASARAGVAPPPSPPLRTLFEDSPLPSCAIFCVESRFVWRPRGKSRPVAVGNAARIPVLAASRGRARRAGWGGRGLGGGGGGHAAAADRSRGQLGGWLSRWCAAPLRRGGLCLLFPPPLPLLPSC